MTAFGLPTPLVTVGFELDPAYMMFATSEKPGTALDRRRIAGLPHGWVLAQDIGCPAEATGVPTADNAAASRPIRTILRIVSSLVKALPG